MIVYKTWFGKNDHYGRAMVWSGWFLLGFIPLYLVRDGVASK